MKRCWFGHDWGKWEWRKVVYVDLYDLKVDKQFRRCARCGYEKDK